MISVSMDEAKARLSELVKAWETEGETVILCRNGREVAGTRALRKAPLNRMLIPPDPAPQALLAPAATPPSR